MPLNPDEITARIGADKLMSAHCDAIATSVYQLGQEMTVETIRTLADLVEEYNFTFFENAVH